MEGVSRRGDHHFNCMSGIDVSIVLLNRQLGYFKGLLLLGAVMNTRQLKGDKLTVGCCDESFAHYTWCARIHTTVLYIYNPHICTRTHMCARTHP